MSNIDWSQMITREMKEAALLAEQYLLLSIEEASWVKGQLAIIADQLLALEDDDPSALPGTEREWRDYRIKVRAWKDGNEDFPLKDKRPLSPAGK